MELPLSTFTSRFSALSLELIDRSFDDRIRGKERFDKFPDLVGEINKRLAKSREFLPFRLSLYAQYIINIQIIPKKSSKN